MEPRCIPSPPLWVLIALLPSPVPPMFQKVGDASAPFETLSQMEEARGGVTEYREIVENSPAYLYCDTNAVPPPELTWYREDQPLSAADGASILQGRPGLRREAGRLQAGIRVSPRAEMVSSAAFLQVLELSRVLLAV